MTQDEALKILQTGANVFLTGEPGTGKTYTITSYIRWLRDKGIEPAITASTGIAATHIGGMTIHSWSGIGVRNYLSEYDLETISANRNVLRRAKNTHVLIIDEVSMLSGDVLSMVDQVLRRVRQIDMPFGGIQVVLVGDFFQLPPVVRRQVKWSEDEYESPFSFHARVWQDLNPFVCYLSEQFRQRDQEFHTLLARIRARDGLEGTHDTLQKRKVAEEKIAENVPRLFAHNADVDKINDARLEQLKGRPHRYAMTGRGPEAATASLKRGCLSPETLVLKEGARVMFTKNDLTTHRFVNGTLGEVISISMDGTPTVKTTDGMVIDVEPMEWSMEENGRILARISQLPLRLAWAITVHKSQGMTLDEAVIDLSKAFEYGQGYVALSRVRALSGLHLIGYNRRALEVHPDVASRDDEFRDRSDDARMRFMDMPPDEHAEYMARFVKAAGGNPEGGVVRKARAVGAKKEDTRDATLDLLKKGKKVGEIARERKLKPSTIIGHLEDLYMKEKIEKDDIRKALSPAFKKSLPKIEAAFARHGSDKLTPVYQELKGVYSFDDLKLARLVLRA